MQEEEQSTVQWAAQRMESSVADVFTVHDVTLGSAGQPGAIRLRGNLQVPSERAYPQIAARLRTLGYTAFLRHDAKVNLDVLLAVPGVQPLESKGRVWVNVLLYVLTILSTLFVGTLGSDSIPANADMTWILTHLWIGWPFALCFLVILTGHELGHYFTARHYKVPVSLPYFIPMPVPPLGTMGAFITMKGRSADRRQMLAVGAAGPLVGFLLAVPILILGLSLSKVQAVTPPAAGMLSWWEGNSLLYMLLKFAMFGKVLPGSGAPANLLAALGEMGRAVLGTFPLDRGYDVFIHPVAVAGWAGLLVTALNLLPVGQLDGGHVLYSLFGQRAKLLTWPIIGLLLVLGIFVWRGWLLWAGLVFFFGQGHPDPLDDVTRLDAPRKLLAVAILLVFVLTFTVLPIREISGAIPISQPSGAGSVFGGAALALAAVLSLARPRYRAARQLLAFRNK